MMRNFFTNCCIFTLVFLLFFSGCVIHPLVAFYSDLSFHTGDHPQEIGEKFGEACVTNVLGIFATGDASVKRAAQIGGIKKITSIDYRIKSVLGIYTEYCVIVTGE